MSVFAGWHSLCRSGIVGQPAIEAFPIVQGIYEVDINNLRQTI